MPLPIPKNIPSLNVVEHLRGLFNQIDLSAQEAQVSLGKQKTNLECSLQQALCLLAKNTETLEALTKVVTGCHSPEVEDLRQLASQASTQVLFHALQGFLWAKRTPAEQKCIETRVEGLYHDLAAIAEVPYCEEVAGGTQGAIERLGLTEQAANGKWFVAGGLGVQAAALLNETRDRHFGAMFKPGPKAIVTMFNNPAEVAQWLPRDASVSQILQELQRRTDDLFPPLPRPSS